MTKNSRTFETRECGRFRLIRFALQGQEMVAILDFQKGENWHLAAPYSEKQLRILSGTVSDAECLFLGRVGQALDAMNVGVSFLASGFRDAADGKRVVRKTFDHAQSVIEACLDGPKP